MSIPREIRCEKDGSEMVLIPGGEFWMGSQVPQFLRWSPPPPPADTPIRTIMRSVGQPLFPDTPVSEAVRRMHQDGIDRVAIVSRDDPSKIMGILSETDLLSLYAKRITP